MKRHIVIGDIHGCAEELKQLLQLIELNKDNDVLVFTGDLIDRGNESDGFLMHY